MQQPRQQLYRKLLGASCATFAVFLLAFCLVPTLMSEASAAENVSTAVTWKTISLTLDPHGDIDFGEVIPSNIDTSIGNYGTQKVVKKAIDVTTNSDTYSVFLSTVGSDNALMTSADTVQAIPAIGGGSSTPTTFTQTSWGYSVPTSETVSTFSAYDDFLASSTDLTVNNLTKQGIGSSVYNTGTWSPVPVMGNASQIHRNTTPSITGFSSGDSFNIYYSVMVDTNTMAGTYENQVVYTAIASDSSGSISYNVSRDKEILTSVPGDIETLQIDLATSPDSLTTSDVEVRLVPHSIFATNSYSVASLIPTDYPACPVNTISSADTSATIACTLPRFDSKGSTDVVGNYTVRDNSTYDFWVKLTLPDSSTLDYISHYRDGSTDIASVTYKVGLQSKNRSGNTIVTSMQQMNSSICENTTAFVDDDTATFSLNDTRDNISYDIRKIGNKCWMVQNLRFIGINLDPTTTDVSTATTIAYGDLTEGNSRDIPRIHSGVDGNGDPTVWYNYAAATAATITGSTNTTEAQSSICPKGWKMPSRTDYNVTIFNTDIIIDHSSPIKYYTNPDFLPTYGGRYWDKGLNYYYVAWWWTTTDFNGIQRYDPRYATGSLTSGTFDVDDRATGDFLRCVAR